MTDDEQDHGHDAAHAPDEELAAAYALDALDEAEAEAFQRHLVDCAACRRAVAELREAAADLAGALEGEDPSPELRQRILDAAAGAPVSAAGARGDGRRSSGAGPVPGRGPLAGPATPTLLLRGRRRARTLLAAAAVVVVLAGAGTAAGILAGSGGPGAPPARCTRAAACSEVVLSSATTHERAAVVLVQHDAVWVRPAGLAPDDPAREEYVLWQLTANREPAAIGAFDVRAGHRRPIAVGSLPRRATAAGYAVSLEPGRRLPAAPSDVVAVGHPA